MLRGPRVLVKLAHPDEAGTMLRFQIDNRDHLLPWYPPIPRNFYQIAYWQSWGKAARVYFENQRAVMCNIWLPEPNQPDRLIGQINFTGIQRGAQQCGTLGYHIGHVQEGQGLMAEALGLFVQWCFEGLHLHRVCANYVVGNARSGRLLHRLGFVEEGLARRFLFVDGAWRDHVLTAITNPRPVEPAETGLILRPRSPEGQAELSGAETEAALFAHAAALAAH